jgi:hypothetical protein
LTAADDLRRAIIQADPRLSKFNPLPRILCFDDFDEGINGWCELVGNHDGNLDNIGAHMRDFRPPQLTNCTFFDIGTHGSMDGTYAMKLATRAQADHTCWVLKRLTYAKLGLVQMEAYFTIKTEATFDGKQWGPRQWDGNYHPSEAQFGDFGISNDIIEGVQGKRYHCALRYVQTDHEGDFVNRWMYKTSLQPSTKMQRAGLVKLPITDPHVLDPGDWKEVPGGYQPLCYNEVPTKINWHYMRWLFDTRTRRNVELQINDLTMDLRDIEVPLYPESYSGCERLLNLCFDVRTHIPVRNFLFVDSVLISVD